LVAIVAILTITVLCSDLGPIVTANLQSASTILAGSISGFGPVSASAQSQSGNDNVIPDINGHMSRDVERNDSDDTPALQPKDHHEANATQPRFRNPLAENNADDEKGHLARHNASDGGNKTVASTAGLGLSALNIRETQDAPIVEGPKINRFSELALRRDVTNDGWWWHFTLDVTPDVARQLRNASLIELRMTVGCEEDSEARSPRALWLASTAAGGSGGDRTRRTRLGHIMQVQVDRGTGPDASRSGFGVFASPHLFETICDFPDKITFEAVFRLDDDHIVIAKLAIDYNAHLSRVANYVGRDHHPYESSVHTAARDEFARKMRTVTNDIDSSFTADDDVQLSPVPEHVRMLL
jgi:hypothetical protein